jgi:integrase
MINNLYKPKGTRIWRWKYRLSPKDEKIADISLRTSDKQVAEKRRTEMLRELEHERAGLLPSKATREFALRKLGDHLDDYVGNLRRSGKSEKHLANIEFRVGRLIADCGWRTAQDATNDSLQVWRRQQAGLSDKTVNDYRDAVRSMFNWMVDNNRIGSNPFRGKDTVKTKEGARQDRCAMSPEMVVRLLDVAGDRTLVYLFAIHTGLRRSELAALNWHDVKLDAEVPFLRVRASITKSGKSMEMRLHDDLLEILRSAKSAAATADEPLFSKVPRIERFRRDLKAAGIPFHDAEGRPLVFHSLRKTFGTNLAATDAPSRVTMTLMRHSCRSLTDQFYTDERLLGTAAAFDRLPSFKKQPSQIASQKLGAEGQNGSSGGTETPAIEPAENVENKGESHVLTLPVTLGQSSGDGGSGGTRTRNLCRDRAAL